MVKRLDLLLVNPIAKKRIYQNLSTDYSAIEPPFWAALTADFIRKKGFSVKILDANAENLDIDEASEIIKDYSPVLTNIVVYGQHPSASTPLMEGVEKLCKKIKEKNEKLEIILTGGHPSALPKRTINEVSCDFVVEGEGFYTIENLLRQTKLSKIPGLWYKQNGEIFSNPRAENIADLDNELRGVAWDLLPMDKYRAHNWHCLGDLDSRPNYASISTTLGCPFNCEFCCINSTFGKPSYRRWKPEWVLKQIDSLVKDYGVKNLKIIDELFVLNPNHFMEIANGISERGYKLNIWAYARVDTTKEEHLPTLKKAGFNWLALGIESGSDKVRTNVTKGKFQQEDIKNIVQKIKDYGINVGGNYIFGLPEDTYKSMQQTLDLAMDLNCEWANFYCAMAYPGSKLYREALEKEWRLPDSWTGYSQHSYECLPLSTEHLSAAEILRFRDNAFNKYFTNQGYLSMIEKKFGADAKKHLEAMTKIKLRRKLFGD